MTRTRLIAAGALAVYVGSVAFANYAIVHGIPGATYNPLSHTYTVPVGFSLVAPAGVYAVALSWPSRDLLQRSAGRAVGALAILLAAVVSWWTSSAVVAVASGGTLLLSEAADMAVYTPLQRRWFVPAVIASGIVAAVVDSLIFLQWSGIGYGNGQLAGLIVGKLWIVTLIGGPVAWALRRKLPTTEGLLPA